MANNGENLNSSNNNNENTRWDELAKSFDKIVGARDPLSGVEKVVAEKLKNHPMIRGAIAGFVAGFIIASAGYENEKNAASKAEDVNRANNMTKVESNQETIMDDDSIEGTMALAGGAVALDPRNDDKDLDAHSGSGEAKITSPYDDLPIGIIDLDEEHYDYTQPSQPMPGPFTAVNNVQPPRPTSTNHATPPHIPGSGNESNGSGGGSEPGHHH